MIVHDLQCDGCGTLLQDPSLLLHSTRTAAERLGWRHLRGRDLCPVCQTEPPEPMEAYDER